MVNQVMLKVPGYSRADVALFAFILLLLILGLSPSDQSQRKPFSVSFWILLTSYCYLYQVLPCLTVFSPTISIWIVPSAFISQTVLSLANTTSSSSLIVRVTFTETFLASVRFSSTCVSPCWQFPYLQWTLLVWQLFKPPSFTRL